MPLESVVKIFKLIEDSLNEGLFDIDAFETEIKKFNILEQYFICEYMTIYYSPQRLNLWLKTQKKEWGMDDETARDIQINAEEFVPALEGMKNSLKRLVQNHKRIYKNFKSLESPFKEEILKDFRIPLYFVPKTINDYEKSKKTYSKLYTRSEFKREVFTIFKDILSERDIEWFFNNSFDFKNNSYPVYLLSIEINKAGRRNKIGEFKGKLFELYNSYISLYKAKKKEFEDYITSHVNDISKQLSNKKIKEIRSDKKGFIIDTGREIEVSESREKFYSQNLKELEKLFKLPPITKIDFAKIAYNAFPFIREDYVKRKIKNPSYTLDQFFDSFSTNSIRKPKENKSKERE